MSKSHYEVLGLKTRCTQAEIRTAYRKIVFEHHPDKSNTQASHEIFLAATAAYEVLNDANRRRQYDEVQRMEKLKHEQNRYKNQANQSQNRGASSGGSNRTNPRPSPQSNYVPRPQPSAGPTVPKGTGMPSQAQYRSSGNSAATTIEVTRLTMMFNRGQLLESEKLALKILQTDPRQPIPYAVLGDLFKQRGDLIRAAEKYAVASQLDPGNDLYRLRHEELLAAVYPSDSELEVQKKPPVGPILIASMVVLIGAAYLAISHEQPVLPELFFVNQFTLGLIAMLAAAGVALGAGLSSGKLLVRYGLMNGRSIEGIGFQQALVIITLISFWAGAGIYAVRGIYQDNFNKSLSRAYAAIGFTLLLFCLSIAISGNGSVLQTFLWGGSLVYPCFLVGWIVADSVRK